MQPMANSNELVCQIRREFEQVELEQEKQKLRSEEREYISAIKELKNLEQADPFTRKHLDISLIRRGQNHIGFASEGQIERRLVKSCVNYLRAVAKKRKLIKMEATNQHERIRFF
jgi:hypothetical protein